MAFTEKSEILERLQSGQFVDFLKERLDLDEHEVPRLGEWANMGTTVGALALRLNALTLEQIDHILDRQERGRQQELFGNLAVELGYMDPDQVNRLLEIQKLSRQWELAAQLVLAGRIDLASLAQELAEFLRPQEVVAG